MKGRRVLVTFIAACATVCIMTPSVAQAAASNPQATNAAVPSARLTDSPNSRCLRGHPTDPQ